MSVSVTSDPLGGLEITNPSPGLGQPTIVMPAEGGGTQIPGGQHKKNPRKGDKDAGDSPPDPFFTLPVYRPSYPAVPGDNSRPLPYNPFPVTPVPASGFWDDIPWNELIGGVSAGYLVYRGLRLIPSLFPPLWETLPLNLATP